MRETRRFTDMLKERSITREWVDAALSEPDLIEDQPDGTRHFLKQIAEYGSRWLRIVVEPSEPVPRLVTAFFDRRLRRSQQ